MTGARALTIALVLAITLVAGIGPTAAHVAPSLDDNNRYLKLTPLGDRVRLAYTIFFGEVPGAGMRPALDTDRNRMISDAEGQAFGDKLGAEVAAGLAVVVDGSAYPVHWSEVVVGMGTPEVAAGTFSVDLVAWLCVSPARGRHAIQLRDRFHLLRPGETEIKVEDGPGVTIERAAIGQTTESTHDYRFVGPGGPLADDGLDLVFVAGATAAVNPNDACASAAPGKGHGLLYLAMGVGGVCAGVLLLILARRRAA